MYDIQLNNGLFEHYGIISCDTSSSPNSGMMVMFYRQAQKDYDSVTSLTQMGKLQLFVSLDGGSHWFVPSWLSNIPNLNPAPGNPYDFCFFSGGFDSTGTLFIFYTLIWQFTNGYSIRSIRYVYSNNPPSSGSWSTPINCYTSPNPNVPGSPEHFAPYGHLLDIYDEILGLRVLIQPYYRYDTNTGQYELNYFVSYNGGASFINNPNSPIYLGTEHYTNPSIVDLGGGDLLLMACDEGNPYQFKQFVSHDFGHTFNEDNNLTTFDSGSSSDVASPPFLSYINYEGVGLVICYYTRRGTSVPGGFREVYQAIAYAKNVAQLDHSKGIDSTSNEWSNYPIQRVILTSPIGQRCKSGYESFFHPLNQYKGIGLTFSHDPHNNNNDQCVPMLMFTKYFDHGSSGQLGKIHDVLNTLIV